MRQKLSRELTHAINVMAHKEAQRQYTVLASALKARALELLDVEMPIYRLLETIAEDCGIAYPHHNSR